MKLGHLFVSASLLLVASCVPSLDDNPPREPKLALPDAFTGGSTTSSSKAESLAKRTWREVFDDPHLQHLIGQAMQRNQEMNIRLQEMIIAKNEARIRDGEILPKVDAGVGTGLEKVGSHTSQGRSDEAHDVPEHLPDFRFGLTASWEVDVWGKLRNAAKAARLRYLATTQGRKLMQTHIVAELAHAYYDLLALDRRLEVLNRNIAIQRNALDVVRLQKAAARGTELPVQRFEAEVLKNRSLEFELRQQIVETENRINVLVGRYPQTVDRDPAQFDRSLPKTITTGLPSSLLENRPDIVEAELRLQAAKLDVAVAKARFFPSLSLDAEVGYESFDPSHLIDTPASIMYGIAGKLTAPLLNRKAIEAQYGSANATQIQAVFAYERTVLDAFTEVTNQLAMVDNLASSYDLQSQQVARLQRSIEVSKILFRSARADYMEVLLTRRDALDAEMDSIETKKRQLHALVNVYEALGGGWR